MSDRWPVLVINLDRSKDRMDLVRKTLKKDELIRIPGVDGRVWESGELDPHGRPKFDPAAIAYLVDEGILGMGATDKWPLLPCEVGCALGHRKAWEYVIENELEFAIICEDDISATVEGRGGLQFSIERQGGMPEDADVMFLTGKDTPVWTMQTDEQGRLKRGWCNYAYVITRKGAQRAIEAQFPMFLPCDIQWWACAFIGYEVTTFVPKLEEQGYAYAMEKAIVKRNGLSYGTTMTPSGQKPWAIESLREDYDVNGNRA